MNKKVWVGALAVFITLAVLEILANTVFFTSMMEEVAEITRPEEEMSGKLWILYVTYAFFAYFFTWIFSKGYEKKGILEGVRYGLAVALMMILPWAYSSYVYFKGWPYSITLTWFLYGTLEMVVCGIVLALIFGMKPKEAAAA